MVRYPHLFPPDAYGLLRSGAEIAEGVEKVGVAEAPVIIRPLRRHSP